MKMTLDQLRVDSYATQVSQKELTEVKGGTFTFCWGIAARAVAIISTIEAAMTEACGGPCDIGELGGNGGSRQFE